MNYLNRFYIDADTRYFNASYGVVPRSVRAYHEELLRECESNPYKWFTRTCKTKIRATKTRLATYLNCDVDDFAIVDNSSSGANSVFNSLALDENSVIVLLETAYSVIKNLSDKCARLYKCTVVTVPVSIEAIDRLAGTLSDQLDSLSRQGYDVKLVCVDHIASCPAIVLPVEEIAAACKTRGISVFVDAAHAIGQVVIDLKALEQAGVCFWVSDTHKWFFSPKGSAVLWVSKVRQDAMYPSIDCAAIGSKGCVLTNPSDDNPCENQPSAFASRFMYLGTKDYTPWIAVSGAMDFVEAHGGYNAIIDRNRSLACWTQDRLNEELNTYSASYDVTASMTNTKLPFIRSTDDAKALMRYLEDNGLYCVIYEFPSDAFWLRLCIQLFVDVADVELLLRELVAYKAMTNTSGASNP